MATELTKRCDVYDTKLNVITVELTLNEVSDKEPLCGQQNPQAVVDMSEATIQMARPIKTARLDLSPRALERLLGYIDRGLSKSIREAK